MPKEIQLPGDLDADTAYEILQDYASTDDAQIVTNSRIETLENAVSEAKEAFAAVLAEDSPQSAETLSRQDMDALTEPFRDDEGDIDVDTLRQNPETGDTTDSGGDDDTPTDSVSVDNLSLSDRDEIKNTLLPKKTSFESRNMQGRVDALEEKIAAKFGADDYSEIESELEAL